MNLITKIKQLEDWYNYYLHVVGWHETTVGFMRLRIELLEQLALQEEW